MYEHQHINWKIYPLIPYGKIVVTKDISFRNIVVGDIQNIVQGIMTLIAFVGLHLDRYHDAILNYHEILFSLFLAIEIMKLSAYLRMA